ncbi:hypothetical protein OAM67_00555 [bacterium]|nr:hypothetical protein [bacterium]
MFASAGRFRPRAKEIPGALPRDERVEAPREEEPREERVEAPREERVKAPREERAEPAREERVEGMICLCPMEVDARNADADDCMCISAADGYVHRIMPPRFEDRMADVQEEPREERREERRQEPREERREQAQKTAQGLTDDVRELQMMYAKR